ncbi:MAG: hypothetical protein A2X78_03875 [Gammaproteobacteria bacterium GWE2_37_16]|nr:MAG: hypothetical protein A2X78_03875 [Gammaproteobacteria bacterium GWE2_37_16]
MTNIFKTIKTPAGELTIIANNKNLLATLWENEILGRVNIQTAKMDKNHPVLQEAEKQLNEYFLGKRQIFNLPLEVHGTSFQEKVWLGLQTIPYGKTMSYAELAGQIGSPKACRAVGGANRVNPISIIIPCHRVIGSNGELTGFAGGLQLKAFLLDLEKQHGRWFC